MHSYTMIIQNNHFRKIHICRVADCRFFTTDMRQCRCPLSEETNSLQRKIFQRRDILLQFLIESVVISGLGGVLGLGLGFAVMSVLENVLGMKLAVTADIIYLAIGFSMGVGVLFGLYPANKASKLRPIEALHYS